jgi:hypothetical protein
MLAAGTNGYYLRSNGNAAPSWETISASGGDNLGNHIATTTLDMAQFPVVNVSSLAIVGDGLHIATSAFGGASGIFISTGGAIQTAGIGHGTVAASARGKGAVELQAARESGSNAATGLYSVIGGGYDNKASNNYAMVSGGYKNSAKQAYSTVSGGDQNNAESDHSTTAGGYWNQATGSYSVISGGNSNRTYNTSATVGGGYANKVSSTYGVIGGGNSNMVSGSYGAVPGGSYNTANGSYSLAAGYYSSSTANGTFTWSDAAGQITENNVANRTWFKNSGGFLVTGSTQPVSDGAFFVNGQGAAQITKVLVQAADSGIGITSADFGKTITVNDTVPRAITLPNVTAADIGASITVVKLGAGTVTITAPSGVYIADSISGGSLYNNLPQNYATVSLRLVTSTKWVIMWGHGCWTTN